MFDDTLITRLKLNGNKIELVEYSNGQIHSGETVYKRVMSLGEELNVLIDGEIQKITFSENGELLKPPLNELKKINNL